MLINNATYQRETLSEQPIPHPLRWEEDRRSTEDYCHITIMIWATLNALDISVYHIVRSLSQASLYKHNSAGFMIWAMGNTLDTSVYHIIWSLNQISLYKHIFCRFHDLSNGLRTWHIGLSCCVIFKSGIIVREYILQAVKQTLITFTSKLSMRSRKEIIIIIK